MSRKAQLELMQTVFVLIFLFLSLFIMFVVIVFKEKTNANLQTEQLIVLTQYKKSQIIDYLLELRCSLENVVLKDCYDKHAINSFPNTISMNSEYYTSLFGHAKITINEFNGDWQTTEIFSNVPENKQDTKTFYNPVLIHDSIEKKKYFGVIEIEIYN